jgi:hypothetical protein
VSLSEGQWALTSGDRTVTMGPGTPYNVSTFEIGEPDGRTSDHPRAREDGDEFGRDYLGGRTISFELNAMSDPYEMVQQTRHRSVLDFLAVLESAWDAEAVRTQPGRTCVLSYCRGGEQRRVYGRPRRFSTVTALDWAGNVPVTAAFRTKDHRFYADGESALTIGFVPEQVGGFVPPLIGPLVMTGQGVGETGFHVGGTEAAWLAYRIDGPIQNPTVEIAEHWSATLNVTLAADQWVLVDPSPWQRAVLRNDGANLSGVFTADSQRLSGMRVRPGARQAILRGIDPTASSRLSLFYRAAYASY